MLKQELSIRCSMWGRGRDRVELLRGSDEPLVLIFLRHHHFRACHSLSQLRRKWKGFTICLGSWLWNEDLCAGSALGINDSGEKEKEAELIRGERLNRDAASIEVTANHARSSEERVAPAVLSWGERAGPLCPCVTKPVPYQGWPCTSMAWDISSVRQPSGFWGKISRMI